MILAEEIVARTRCDNFSVSAVKPDPSENITAASKLSPTLICEVSRKVIVINNKSACVNAKVLAKSTWTFLEVLDCALIPRVYRGQPEEDTCKAVATQKSKVVQA